MDKYIKKLYDEFLCTIDPKYITKKTDKILFERWLGTKQEILKYYVQLLDDMDFIPSKGVVEFDKGIYDTALKYINKEYNKILVSKFAKTVKNEKKLIAVDGELSVDKNDVYLEYNNNMNVISSIRSYITQYPVNEETINKMCELNDSGKNIFIGTYGSLTDLDKDFKLKKLYDLKRELQLNLNKYFYGDVVYTGKYYLAAITPKFNTNIKKEKIIKR